MQNKIKIQQTKPVPVRLNELQEPMREVAHGLDRSMNWVIRLACKEFLKRQKKPSRPTK